MIVFMCNNQTSRQKILPHMSRRNHTNTSKVPLKADLQNMNKFISRISCLQHQISQKVLQRQQSFQVCQEATSSRIQSLSAQFSHFRQLFTTFSSQCKHQWTSVYQQLLLIINNIVELYQIRLQKLQAKIEEQQQTIHRLSKRNSCDLDKQKLVTQGYQGENQYECRDILESLEHSILQNNQKKVKISDVIASYHSSVVSSHTNKDEEHDLHNLPPTTKHHNSLQDNPKFFKSNKSQILINSIGQLSLTQTLKTNNTKTNAKRQTNSIEQKQNHASFISSRKVSELPQSKRGFSKTGGRQGQSVSKLSELRKYLYNRTK